MSARRRKAGPSRSSEPGDPPRPTDAKPPLRLRRRRRIVPELEVALPRPGRSGRGAKRGSASAADTPAGDKAEPAAPAVHAPLYWRALRLRHVHPNGWQRAAMIEGVVVFAVILVLAGVATAWSILVLPVVVALLVKAHDLLVGALTQPRSQQGNGPSST
jgi:hypothetical protein